MIARLAIAAAAVLVGGARAAPTADPLRRWAPGSQRIFSAKVDFLLDRAIAYIRGVPAKRITVTGWAATAPAKVWGREPAGAPGIARTRAERIADPEADGLADASRRRPDIDVTIDG